MPDQVRHDASPKWIGIETPRIGDSPDIGGLPAVLRRSRADGLAKPAPFRLLPSGRGRQHAHGLPATPIGRRPSGRRPPCPGASRSPARPAAPSAGRALLLVENRSQRRIGGSFLSSSPSASSSPSPPIPNTRIENRAEKTTMKRPLRPPSPSPSGGGPSDGSGQSSRGDGAGLSAE